MGETLGHFDESEMRSFGLDPEVQKDRIIWAQSEPVPHEEDAHHDYSQDIEAYGSEALKVPEQRSVKDMMSQEAMGRLGSKSLFADPKTRSYLGQVRGH